MSRLLGILVVVMCFACVPVKAGARSRVWITVATTGDVNVEAELSVPARSWSFRNAYAGALDVAERIREFHAFTDSGESATAKPILIGEFRSGVDANRISYKVRLTEPRLSEVSHVSWIVGDRGFLMFADLLPLDIESVSAEIALPSGWGVASSVEAGANGHYEVLEPERAVFFIGRDLRKKSKNVNGLKLETVLSGSWSFKDSDVLNAASRVIKKYLALTGFRLRDKPVVMIAPLPVRAGSTKWKAETRGSTVVLLMDPTAAIANWRGQLGVIFTHELLHLWVPNSLKLEGDYDWFYEGFTLYIALGTALNLKIIKFQEFLDTLARVYDSYLSYADNLSLIDASARRWTSHGSFVYDKGMLVAFLYDLMIRKESDGKMTLADRYRELFNGGVADRARANEVIIGLLASSPTLKDLAKSYIENSSELKLEQILRAYGLQLNTGGKSSQLRVIRELDPGQKRLLRSLGY